MRNRARYGSAHRALNDLGRYPSTPHQQACALAALLDDPNWHPSEAECRRAEAAVRAPAQSPQQRLALDLPSAVAP